MTHLHSMHSCFHRHVSSIRTATILGIFLAIPTFAFSQGLGNFPVLISNSTSATSYSIPIQTVLFFTLLSFLPSLILLMTGFTRIVIVLSLLRQALGTQSSPPNQVIIGLSLFLTLFVMGPTIDEIYLKSYLPYTKNQISFEQASTSAETPIREFMIRQTRESDFKLFVNLAKLPPDIQPQNAPFRVIVPAFAISELKTAFQIGFLIFIPFLIIDIIVASILMSLGMMMLSPVLIALPFKILLFVLSDGWNLLIGSLAASFSN